MPVYFVCCRRIRSSGVVIGLSESHRSLADAFLAMQEHQQRQWSSVTLTPVWPPTHQLSLFV